MMNMKNQKEQNICCDTGRTDYFGNGNSYGNVCFWMIQLIYTAMEVRT